jgi:hypothetical protein
MIIKVCVSIIIFLVLFTLYCMLKVAKLADETIENMNKNGLK